ncbi:MAG TPA: VWA domain-containing protein [Vicinamibacterales bacterium]|nr:VWA domain-containing protein [Vicinamibacterales bacterium]
MAAAQQPVYRSSVDLIVVYPTVRTESGRFVTGLKPGDFLITDNGAPVEIAAFSNDPQPLRVVMLLDMSESMRPHLVDVRKAAAAFVDSLAEQDRLRLGTFGHEVALSPHSTSDKSILRRVLREEVWPGGRTPLWQALHEAAAALDGEAGRKVILLVSDGNDHSEWSRSAALERLRRSEVLTYAVTLNGTALHWEFRRFLAKTGGTHISLPRGGDLARAMTAIADELRHQYMIGFVPTAMDGAWHRLTVAVPTGRHVVKAPQGFEARR